MASGEWNAIGVDAMAPTGQIAVMTLSGFPRITVDPAICGGRPTITGTRMRVTDLLETLADGATPEEIAADFPYISVADVHAALAFAATTTDHPIILAAE